MGEEDIHNILEKSKLLHSTSVLHLTLRPVPVNSSLSPMKWVHGKKVNILHWKINLCHPTGFKGIHAKIFLICPWYYAGFLLPGEYIQCSSLTCTSDWDRKAVCSFFLFYRFRLCGRVTRNLCVLETKKQGNIFLFLSKNENFLWMLNSIPNYCTHFLCLYAQKFNNCIFPFSLFYLLTILPDNFRYFKKWDSVLKRGITY